MQEGVGDKVNTLRRLCDELNKALEQEQVALSLVLGMETGMELDLVEQVEKGDSLTINNSRYILVEPPFSQLPLFWEGGIVQVAAWWDCSPFLLTLSGRTRYRPNLT